MNATYWKDAATALAGNLVSDFKRAQPERFVFTKTLLRSAITFNNRALAPTRHFLDLFPEAERLNVEMGNVLYTRSNANPFEHYCLQCIAQIQQPQRIFEFGTFDGATTLRLATSAPTAQVLTLDLNPESIKEDQPASVATEVQNIRRGGVGHRFHNHPASTRIQQLWGDSLTFDYSPHYGSVDLAFIDACHDYSFAKSDTANALRMVKRGVIVWHDYHPGWPGVVKAVDECLSSYSISHIAGTSLAILDLSGE